MNAPSRVLDVGNCDPDHGAISGMLRQVFDVQIDRVMFVPDALERLRQHRYDLVLVNRLIFDDGSPGIELIQRMQADAELRRTPVMMISNFEDAQQTAVAAGAVHGFGKAALDEPSTVRLLTAYLRRR